LTPATRYELDSRKRDSSPRAAAGDSIGNSVCKRIIRRLPDGQVSGGWKSKVQSQNFSSCNSCITAGVNYILGERGTKRHWNRSFLWGACNQLNFLEIPVLASTSFRLDVGGCETGVLAPTSPENGDCHSPLGTALAYTISSLARRSLLTVQPALQGSSPAGSAKRSSMDCIGAYSRESRCRMCGWKAFMDGGGKTNIPFWLRNTRADHVM
jgi:hypothetical protein